MIRHGYTTCSVCHVDPSGAGLLTAYGRAQSELLLSTRYSKRAESEGEEASPRSEAFFGVLPLPEWLLVGGWLREGYLWNTSDGKLVDKRFLQMRADLGAHVSVGRFRANGTLGVANGASAALAQQAWVTSNADKEGLNLVSREHWAGAEFADGAVFVRAGRMNLPFGLRNIEHFSWVRSETRTDTNQAQSHGLAASFAFGQWRGEAMALAGNLQLNPDRYRERGVSAFAEYAVSSSVAVGASSLVTYAETDIASKRETYRHAHGLFARAAAKRLVLLAEADLLGASTKQVGSEVGATAFVQADIEVVQGVHAMATFEALQRAERDAKGSVGGWLSAAWFIYPHIDVRGDVVARSVLAATNSVTTTTYLLQLHGYL